MPITLGNTTISGLGVGGLPSGTVNSDSLASSLNFSDKTLSGLVLSQGMSTTTSDASRSGGFEDLLSSTQFTVPSGSTALVWSTGVCHGNFESAAGQGQGRVQARGSGLTTQTSTAVEWHRGFFSNYAGAAGVASATFQLGAGTWTLFFQTASANGTFISNYYSSRDTFNWFVLKIS
jgi:hypothetical protein